MKRKEIIKKIDRKYKELEDLKNHMSNNLTAARNLQVNSNILLEKLKEVEVEPEVEDVEPDEPEVVSIPLPATYIENCSHTVGYCEGSMFQLETMKYYLSVSKKQYKKDIKSKKIKK